MIQLLTIKEVASILKISENTAKIWASRRVFPVVKIGRLVRISPKALQEWLDRRTEMRSANVTVISGHEESKIRKSGSFEDYIENLKASDDKK